MTAPYREPDAERVRERDRVRRAISEARAELKAAIAELDKVLRYRRSPWESEVVNEALAVFNGERGHSRRAIAHAADWFAVADPMWALAIASIVEAQFIDVRALFASFALLLTVDAAATTDRFARSGLADPVRWPAYRILLAIIAVALGAWAGGAS